MSRNLKAPPRGLAKEARLQENDEGAGEVSAARRGDVQVFSMWSSIFRAPGTSIDAASTFFLQICNSIYEKVPQSLSWHLVWFPSRSL